MTREEKFIESLYDEAEEEIKEVYKEQKKNRDNLLQELALIMLTYTVLDGLMSLKSKDKKKEYNKLSNIIKTNYRGTGEIQNGVITDILTKTVNNTFDFYSYNAGLKDVQAIIDKNFKGKHFSDRVWENERDTAKHLHKQVNDFLNGKVNVNQIKRDIEKTFNGGAYNTKRLVETEVNRCSSNAFDRFCKEVGVKRVRYNATLDSRLCSDCAQYHDKVFDFKDKIEVPRHPLCRCFYTIEDDEDILNEKRGKDIGSKVNWDIVNSDEYKEKFKGISKSVNVDNEIYNISKRILKHRDGSIFEDLYIVDLKTGKTITYTTQDTEKGVKRTIKLEKILNRNNKDYVIIHNHPHSGNFSDSDLNTLFNSNSISKIIAAGHDGTLYTMNSKNLEINIANELNVYYTKIKKQGYSSVTAEEMAFNIISDKYGLDYERR